LASIVRRMGWVAEGVFRGGVVEEAEGVFVEGGG
jgi:hypothetical protein